MPSLFASDRSTGCLKSVGSKFQHSGPQRRYGNRLLEPVLDVSEARAEEVDPVEPELELEMPGEAIFVGGYARIPISLPAGLEVEDLEFVVSGGGGFVSKSEERSQQTPAILLAAGRKVG